MPNKRSQMKGGWSKPKPKPKPKRAAKKAAKPKKSTARKLGDTYVKTMKWAVPKVFGLHNPLVTGGRKILPKWHPLSTKKKK